MDRPEKIRVNAIIGFTLMVYFLLIFTDYQHAKA